MTAPTKDLRPPLSSFRRRLYGVALLVIMALIVAANLASFNKLFTPVEMVTLRTETVGNQLAPLGDVKVRGVIVGEIRTVESDGQLATIQMAIDPDAISAIPSNTTAMLIPKTLFGERFVSLNIPPDPSPRPLQDGDVIGPDRSQNATETEQLLNNLLPVLTAVQPEKVSDTLGAISQALSGRGEQLGDTLVQLNRYLEGINPSLPDLIGTIQALSPTADIFTAASPDLIGALDNLVTTSRTLVEERAAFEDTFRSVTSASNVTTDFLAANRDTIIELNARARPVLSLLGFYSPEFPCLFQQLTDLTPKINDVLQPGTGIQIAAEIVIDRGKYVPSDAPIYGDRRGPRCYIIEGETPQYPPGGPFVDGSFAPPASPGGGTAPGGSDQPFPGPPTTIDERFGGGSSAARAGTTSAGSEQGTTDGNTTTTGSTAPEGSEGAGTADPAQTTAPDDEPSSGAETETQSAGRIDAANIGLPNTPNSPEERTLVTELTALQMSLRPADLPAWAPYLTAATMRGTTVEIS